MKMNQIFFGKVVLITGAASGLGAATAEHFANFGASLSLIDLNLQELQKIGEKCKQEGIEKPLLIKADMTTEEDVKQIIVATIEKFGKLDILINCAGIYEKGSSESTSLKQYDKIFSINARAGFQLTILAIPHLIATKGNIINMSSVVSLIPTPSALVYSLSKGFIDHFTRNLALDLAPKGVRVNSVNPGTTVTNIYKHSGMSDEEVKQFLEVSRASHPLGRVGNAANVVKAIAFLASDDAEHITGVNLPVDGGRHLT